MRDLHSGAELVPLPFGELEEKRRKKNGHTPVCQIKSPPNARGLLLFVSSTPPVSPTKGVGTQLIKGHKAPDSRPCVQTPCCVSLWARNLPAFSSGSMYRVGSDMMGTPIRLTS